VLDAANVQGGRVEVYLLPTQVTDLRGSQPMAKRQQDHECVAMAWRLALAASINLSTSPIVRCSRVRSAALGWRSGAGASTVRFSVVGALSAGDEFSMRMAPFDLGQFKLQLFMNASEGPLRSFAEQPHSCAALDRCLRNRD
jgi:hypothetical protein